MQIPERKAKKNLVSKIPFFISFLFQLYFVGLLIFGLLRLALLLYTADENIQLFNSITLKSFLIGFQFDTVILTYILLIPLLLLYIQSVFFIKKKYITRFITLFLSIVFPLLVFISIADIPYFKFFRNRLSEASLQWLGNMDIVLKMISGNAANLSFFIIALITTFLVGYLVFRYCRNKLVRHDWNVDYNKHNKIYYSISFLFAGFFCFMGMRGTISHPIRQGDAFYCNNPLLNQIGLNPAFTLMKSFSDKVNLMDEKLAIKTTQQLLQINSPINTISPIAQEIKNDSLMSKHNVVLVLMEGLSANYMGVFGNKNNLTPTLDSLSKISWFFKNAYSAGIHTNNGIFSSLFSFPALRRVRPMSTVPVRIYSGLPYTLKENGYKNFFFCPHGEAFDNIGNFIPGNFFDELYSAEDFPADKAIGPFGVPDDYLFSYAVNKLSKYDSTKPFFATILTASNHDPYILPDYFKSSRKEQDLKAVSFADWSINKFLTEAKKCKWYDNTIFVFVSDHGRLVGENSYDLALSYNHIPIIMFAPKILGEAKENENFIGQIDLFPTIMGILKGSYVNNTLGVNVLKQKRECIYFSADDKMGCIDDEWLYIYRFNGNEGLYQYKTGNTENFSMAKKIEFVRLKKYALSQTQVAEWMISNDKTSLVKK